MTLRSYGQTGPWVIVLHGGPGAPGTMAPVARGLEDAYRVLEPWQRTSGGEPLTVARHVADLDDLIQTHCGNIHRLQTGATLSDRDTSRPALVGSSWGAMLALAYAAAHPQRVGPIVLIGCGTFDVVSREKKKATVDQRMDDCLRKELDHLDEEHENPDDRFRAMGELVLPLYSYKLATTNQELRQCDIRGYRESWADMLRLQENGTYPATFAAIRTPVLMLHGVVDPHPGPMIRASLAPYLPQLEYREWPPCGHYPWLESAVRDEFFALLRSWLRQRFGDESFAARHPSG